MGQHFILMHGNTHPHTAGMVNQWLQQYNVPNLERPDLSLDLNSIEHAWDKLLRKTLRSYSENLVTESELFEPGTLSHKKILIISSSIVADGLSKSEVLLQIIKFFL